MRCLCIQTHMSGKKKKKLTLLVRMVDAWPCGRVACGRGWWWIPRWRVDADVLRADVDEYKEKRKKKAYFVGADGGHVALRTCSCGRGWWWTWMVVDADGGGCGWWWMRMVVDADGGGCGW